MYRTLKTRKKRCETSRLVDRSYSLTSERSTCKSVCDPLGDVKEDWRWNAKLWVGDKTGSPNISISYMLRAYAFVESSWKVYLLVNFRGSLLLLFVRLLACLPLEPATTLSCFGPPALRPCVCGSESVSQFNKQGCKMQVNQNQLQSIKNFDCNNHVCKL